MRLDALSECTATAETPSELERCQEQIEDNGYEFVGEGVARLVYSDGDQVIKFAKDPGVKGPPDPDANGKLQNRLEVERWESASSDEPLAAVRDYGEDYRWIRMEKVPGDVTQEEVDELELEGYPDRKWHNFGRTGDDEIKMIDYGGTTSER